MVADIERVVADVERVAKSASTVGCGRARRLQPGHRRGHQNPGQDGRENEVVQDLQGCCGPAEEVGKSLPSHYETRKVISL